VDFLIEPNSIGWEQSGSLAFMIGAFGILRNTVRFAITFGKIL